MVAFYQHCKDIAEGKPSRGPFAYLLERAGGPCPEPRRSASGGASRREALTGPVLSGPQRSEGAVEGLNAGLNARPKALSAAQSKKERDLLNSALVQIDRELEKMQELQTNNQPVPQQSDPKYEIPPD